MVNANRIKSLMSMHDINARELAAKVGISDSMMSFVLRGLKEPSVSVLSRIADVLGCTVDDIIIKEERKKA